MSDFDYREFNDNLRVMLLKSETGTAFDEPLVTDLGWIQISFGKYIGKCLKDIPLRYLDETIAIMPPTYFVRRVQEFVDNSMRHPMIVQNYHAKAPDKSVEQLNENWYEAACRDHGIEP